MNGASGIEVPQEVGIPAGWPGARFQRDRVDAIAVAASALGSLVIAVTLHASLAAALALVILVAAGAFIARRGLMGVALLLVAALPWLVVFGAVVPKLTETFTAGTAVAVLLLVARPKLDGSRVSNRLRLGIVLFYTPVIIALARNPGGAQFIEAAKYIVFPFTVLAVTAGTNRFALTRLGMVGLGSGALAITVNLLLGAVGLNHSYYHAGDIEGLGGEHDVALLAGAVTAASLGMGASLRWAPVSVSGAIATIATGVRSTLPGLLLALTARMVNAGMRLRSVVVVAVAVGAVLISGVDNVLVNRFAFAEQAGQFSSFAALGSGRGAIYTTAIHAWWISSPVEWFVGTGLRSIPAFEQQATGVAAVGHSDVIQVGVEIGLIGLLGLILMWWTLIARARCKWPLLVVLPFSLFNGVLEYGAPLVISILLTTCSDSTVGAQGGKALRLSSSPGAGRSVGQVRG